MSKTHFNPMQHFLENLKKNRYYAPQIVYHHRIPPQEGKWIKEEQISPALIKSLNNLHIKALYAHQALAIQKIRQGENVVVATPTASGKTLIYTLPVVESLLQDPKTKALYIFPLKALEQDQLKALQQFIAPLDSELNLPMPAAIYDGDTSSYRRQKIREVIPPVLITNPDMVHLSLLPFHTQWSSFFQNLRYVIFRRTPYISRNLRFAPYPNYAPPGAGLRILWRPPPIYCVFSYHSQSPRICRKDNWSTFYGSGGKRSASTGKKFFISQPHDFPLYLSR